MNVRNKRLRQQTCTVKPEAVALGRRLQHFLPLHELERQLLRSCRNGAIDPPMNDYPEARSEDNVVRAEFLRFLLLGGDEDNPVHERGVELGGAWIEGRLDLEAARIVKGYALVHCHFSDVPRLLDAKIEGSVYMDACVLPGMMADRLWTSGLFSMRRCELRGALELRGARIDGGLLCANAQFSNTETDSLDGTGLHLGGDAIFSEVSAAGRLDLSKSVVRGSVVALGASLSPRDGIAFDLSRAEVGNNVRFEKAKVHGEILLLGARVGGDVDFEEAELKSDKGDVLSMDRVFVEGNLRLRNGFSAAGSLRLPGARIENNIYFGDCRIEAHEGCAIHADSVLVNGGIFFMEGFDVAGMVDLSGAMIKGDLILENAGFESDSYTLVADGACVERMFKLKGMVKPLTNASFEHASFGRIQDEARSWGTGILLDGLVYKSFASPASTSAQMRLAWLDKQPPAFSGTRKTASFRPQPWRQLRKVLMESGHFEDARHVGIAYERRLRAAGLIGQSASTRPWLVKKVNWATATLAHKLFEVLIGYGYRPARLLAWIVAVWLTCGAFYWYAALQGVMGPSNPIVFQHPAYAHCAKDADGGWYLCKELPEEYTGFSPLAYSMDVLLPFVDLQQESDWAPRVPTPKGDWLAEYGARGLKHAVRFVLWCEIIFGWVAGVLLVAVVSGLTKRTED